MSRGLGVVVVMVGFEAVFVVFGMVDWVGWGDFKKNIPLYPMGKNEGEVFQGVAGSLVPGVGADLDFGVFTEFPKAILKRW
jgi:hypothetical protein